MTESHDDLPATPAGISFEDWAALLTGTSSGPAPLKPPAPSVPETTPLSALDAFEEQWRASLQADAPEAPPVAYTSSDAPEGFTAAATAAEPVIEPAPVYGEPVDFGIAEYAPVSGDIAPIGEQLTIPAPAAPSFADVIAPDAPALPDADPSSTAAVEVAAASVFVLPDDGIQDESPSVPPVQASVPPAPVRPDIPEVEPQTSEAKRNKRMNTTHLAARDTADSDLIEALFEVVAQGASDLHVTANSAPTIRVHGGLKQLPGPMWTSDKVRQALFSILSAEQKARFERELELDFAYSISANARFRVNFYQQRAHVGAAFRIIPTEIKTLGQLGVPESVGRFATLPRGLVLVTGPTGSGKSTTLAALIDLVNSTRADHIVTVEDPIEFMHNHKKSLVNQREVGHDTHSFAQALKHVLRQDPDVILVGELRDLETISVALTAAETGHLVFATLHTQSAAQTIDRIIDVYPPHQQNQVRAQLAATLQGVVCQTLIKKASGDGRVVATEVLITTPAVSNLIREGQTHQVPTAMQAGGSFGMHTLDQHLADLVNRKVITQQAAVDKAQDPESLLTLLDKVEARSSVMSQTGIDFDDAYSARGRH